MNNKQDLEKNGKKGGKATFHLTLQKNLMKKNPNIMY